MGLQASRDLFNDRLGNSTPTVENRSPADLNDVCVGQHSNHRALGRALDLPIEQAFAHQLRFQMMAFVGYTLWIIIHAASPRYPVLVRIDDRANIFTLERPREQAGL